MNNKSYLLFILYAVFILFSGCNSSGNQPPLSERVDSTVTLKNDSQPVILSPTSDTTGDPARIKRNPEVEKAEAAIVLVYNFHVTNRCPTCIAIEEATAKTLDTYFSDAVRQGRIKRQVLNVDDKANKEISEKYEAFGSGLFITRIYKGKETTADLTGEGFKYARNKEEKFIEILKNKISEYLQ